MVVCLDDEGSGTGDDLIVVIGCKASFARQDCQSIDGDTAGSGAQFHQVGIRTDIADAVAGDVDFQLLTGKLIVGKGMKACLYGGADTGQVTDAIRGMVSISRASASIEAGD